jgi:hypothetical protein
MFVVKGKRRNRTAADGCASWNANFAGKPVGSKSASGYLYTKIFGRTYSVHRLAWLVETGDWPENNVDHRNGVRTDNKWKNFRPATHSENGQNIGISKNNKSGFIGVFLEKKSGKWKAEITKDRKKYFLGLFDTPELASAAYKAAKARLHTFQPTLRD